MGSKDKLSKSDEVTITAMKTCEVEYDRILKETNNSLQHLIVDHTYTKLAKDLTEMLPDLCSGLQNTRCLNITDLNLKMEKSRPPSKNSKSKIEDFQRVLREIKTTSREINTKLKEKEKQIAKERNSNEEFKIKRIDIDFDKTYNIVNPWLRVIAKYDGLLAVFVQKPPTRRDSINQGERTNNVNSQQSSIAKPCETPPKPASAKGSKGDKHELKQTTLQVTNLQRKSSELSLDVKRLEKENNGLKQKVHELQQSLEMKGTVKQQPRHIQKDVVNEYEEKLDRKTQLIKEIEQKYEERVNELKDKISELSNSLSKELSEKLSANESSVENVSIRNRPINIAEDYYNFCSNAWLDAKNTLDENEKSTIDEFEALKFLDRILKTSEREAKMILEKFYLSLNSFVFCPHVMGQNPSDCSGDKLPLELTNGLGDLMRKHSERTDMKELCQIVNRAVADEERNKAFIPILKEQDIRRYIMEATKIAWNMVIQRPPMEFAWSGKTQAWDEKSQEPYWRCDPYKKGSVVKFYIHPALYHGGNLMVKGKVYIN